MSEVLGMFSHITLGVDDLYSATRFYDAVMSVLGYQRHSNGDTFAGYGHPDNAILGTDSLWVLKPLDGRPSSSGNGTNVAFRAANRQQVDDFHQKALALGGTDEGKPGVRTEVHPNFYAGYVRDPFGNKLVAVCHDPE